MNEMPVFEFLQLPPELRFAIWGHAAANGAWQDLSQCSRQCLEESIASRHCDPPCDSSGSTDKRVEIIIDSSYHMGRWLDIRYFWSGPGPHPGQTRSRVLCSSLQDINPETIKKHLLFREDVKQVTVRLIPPHQGDFFGAFLMMFAKASDVGVLLQRARWRVSSPPYAPSNVPLEIIFDQALVQDGGGYNMFWESQFDEKLPSSLLSFVLVDRGSFPSVVPCVYEYFLSVVSEWGSDSTEFAAQSSICIPKSANAPSLALVGQLFDGLLADKKASDMLDAGTETGSESDTSVETVSNAGTGMSRSPDGAAWAQWVCRTHLNVVRGWTYIYDADTDVHHVLWKLKDLVWCHAQDLRDNLPLYLDHHVGPRGGPLDMLRLHRFKTMGTARSGLFSRSGSLPVTEYARWRGIGHWQTDRSISETERVIAEGLQHLFNPMASLRTRTLRQQCRHLRSVEWSTLDTAGNDASDGHCPPELWLKAYPRGISFGHKGLVTWHDYSGFCGPSDCCQEMVRARDCHMCCSGAAKAWVELGSLVLYPQRSFENSGVGVQAQRFLHLLPNGFDNPLVVVSNLMNCAVPRWATNKSQCYMRAHRYIPNYKRDYKSFNLSGFARAGILVDGYSQDRVMGTTRH